MSQQNKPNFPKLSRAKSDRVITKHFVNLSLVLPRGEFSLLTWLIYQSDIHNRVEYSITLLKRYQLACKYALEEYNGTNPPKSIPSLRKAYNSLLEQGYIVRDSKGDYINKSLTYRIR